MKQRLAAIDCLRGIAAFAVLLRHYTNNYRVLYGHDFPDSFDFIYGHLGVELFFIISGFVIFMSVQGNVSVPQFATKRFLRLYPTFYVCVAITFCVVAYYGLPGRESKLRDLAANLTMVPHLLGRKLVDGAHWSLPQEIYFYVLIALLLALKQMKHISYWSLLWLSIAAFHLLHPLPKLYAGLLNAQYSPFFVAGVHYYKLFTHRQAARKDRTGWHLMILACFVLMWSGPLKLDEKWVVTSFFIVFYLFVDGRLNWLQNRLLLWLGAISYPLYLLHQNIGYVILNQTKPWLQQYPILYLALPTAVVLALAHIITYYFEKPLLRTLKSKFNLH